MKKISCRNRVAPEASLDRRFEMLVMGECRFDNFPIAGDTPGIRCGLLHFSRRCYGEPNCDRYFSRFPIALRRFEQPVIDLLLNGLHQRLWRTFDLGGLNCSVCPYDQVCSDRGRPFVSSQGGVNCALNAHQSHDNLRSCSKSIKPKRRFRGRRCGLRFYIPWSTR